jgi:hypothetical protein
MATKKPKSETRKNKKLTLKKGTVRDLTARRDVADAVRGGMNWSQRVGPISCQLCDP